ncbi:hypothetical protein HZS_6816 [Henneguya salminicola]|nr:hypothetical protein HZS_6816 [Henneguya salminicola]
MHINIFFLIFLYYSVLPIKEYRSARKSEALVKYVLNDIQTEPKPIVSEDEIDKSKDYFLGKFLDHNTPQYIKFKEIISELHDDCVAFAIFQFLLSFNFSSDHHFPGHITFHPSAVIFL